VLLLIFPITLPTREVIGKLPITNFYDIISTEIREGLQCFETKTRRKYKRETKASGLGPNPRVSTLQN